MALFALASAAVVLGLTWDAGHPYIGAIAAGAILVNAFLVIWATDIFDTGRRHQSHISD